MSFISLARSTIPLSDFRTAGLLLSALSAGVTDPGNKPFQTIKFPPLQNGSKHGHRSYFLSRLQTFLKTVRVLYVCYLTPWQPAGAAICAAIRLVCVFRCQTQIISSGFRVL